MKPTRMLSLAIPVAVLAALALPAGAAEERAPEVTRKGRTVVQYRDSSLQAVLGYRWMNANPKATWVPLQFAVSAGTEGRPIEIAREDVSLVTPSGERVPLPTQKAFMEGVKNPPQILQQLRVTRDPIAGYFPGRTQDERLAFFTDITRRGVSYDRVSVNRSVLAYGLLWFPLPGGVAPGRYRLEIRSKYAHLELPFDVPAPPLGEGKDDVADW